MEKKDEKRKLLLVAISSGLFLAISIGAAIMVFAPRNSQAVAYARTGSPAGQMTNAPSSSFQGPSRMPNFDTQRTPTDPPAIDPVELVRNNTETPGLQPPPERPFRHDDDFYVSGGSTINVIPPNSAAVPDTPQPERSAPAPAATRSPAAPRPAPPAAASRPQAPARSTPVPAAVPARPAQARPAPSAAQAAGINDFWVQAGAFSTVTRAESVKDNLSSRGIASIIDNREINGRLLFRVRIGPYTSKTEADYWLSLIKSMDGFKDSQVRQTVRYEL